MITAAEVLREADARLALKSLDEMELSGNRTYWHGSLNPPPIDTSENSRALGKHKCFFFTSHFGYALSYIYRVLCEEDFKFYKQYPKMTREIDAKGMSLIGTKRSGYLYPLSLKPGTNIYDSHSGGDIRYMFEMIGKNSRLNKIFADNKIDKMDFCFKLAKNDWVDVEEPGSDIFVNGLERNDFIELLHENTDGVVFHGFSNMEYGDFHSIGIFKDKMAHLGQGKPFIARFDQEASKIIIGY